MGTNYYAIPKLTDDVKFKIIEAVVENDIAKIKRLLPKSIHIGKFSSGWPFLLNHNNWEYYNSIEELKQFIYDCDIEDEYGADISGLWNLIEGQKKELGVEKFTNSEHSQYYIIRDGYGFSTSVDFS